MLTAHFNCKREVLRAKQTSVKEIVYPILTEEG
jgi:hypothetical protein